MAAAAAVQPIPGRRNLGMVETTWCSLLEGGTGTIVCGLCFDRVLDETAVQAALDDLINQFPYLNTQICCSTAGEKNRHMWFELRRERLTLIKPANPFAGGGGEAEETWSKIVDLEANKRFPSAKKDGSAPVFQVVLYKHLPVFASLLVLKMQTSAFDLPSVETILPKFVIALQKSVEVEEGTRPQDNSPPKIPETFTYHPPMEELIPRGVGDKSVISRGVSMLGYGLTASRQRFLPFNDEKSRKLTRHIRSVLSPEATSRLLQACKRNSTDLYGAITSSTLKAIADYKHVGKTKEQYCVAVVLNCRSELSPPLPLDTIGFYCAAVVASTQVTEGASSSFWKVAADASQAFDESFKRHRFFKDIKELNHLTNMALKQASASPNAALRTSAVTLQHDPITLDLPKRSADLLHLRDQIVLTSCHGLGPCLGLCSFMKDGALGLTVSYPSPLIARAEVKNVLDRCITYLVENS